MENQLTINEIAMALGNMQLQLLLAQKNIAILESKTKKTADDENANGKGDLKG